MKNYTPPLLCPRKNPNYKGKLRTWEIVLNNIGGALKIETNTRSKIVSLVLSNRSLEAIRVDAHLGMIEELRDLLNDCICHAASESPTPEKQEER